MSGRVCAIFGKTCTAPEANVRPARQFWKPTSSCFSEEVRNLIQRDKHILLFSCRPQCISTISMDASVHSNYKGRLYLVILSLIATAATNAQVEPRWWTDTRYHDVHKGTFVGLSSGRVAIKDDGQTREIAVDDLSEWDRKWIDSLASPWSVPEKAGKFAMVGRDLWSLDSARMVLSEWQKSGENMEVRLIENMPPGKYLARPQHSPFGFASSVTIFSPYVSRLAFEHDTDRPIPQGSGFLSSDLRRLGYLENGDLWLADVDWWNAKVANHRKITSLGVLMRRPLLWYKNDLYFWMGRNENRPVLKINLANGELQEFKGAAFAEEMRNAWISPTRRFVCRNEEEFVQCYDTSKLVNRVESRTSMSMSRRLIGGNANLESSIQRALLPGMTTTALSVACHSQRQRIFSPLL